MTNLNRPADTSAAARPTLADTLREMRRSQPPPYTFSFPDVGHFIDFEKGMRAGAEKMMPHQKALWELHDRMDHGDRYWDFETNSKLLCREECPKCALAAILGDRP